MKKILIVNGPNLNLLGKREPEVYGSTTLKELEKICTHESKKLNFKVSFFQSNSEKIPKIEVHISNIYSREEFRKKSFISPAVHGIIAGFGIDVYIMALRSLKYLFKNE